MTNVLYMKGMNGMESDDDMEEEEEDIWDDRKLNDAYDKALKMANLEVAKRVAMATNSTGPKKEKSAETTQPQTTSNRNKQQKKNKPNKTQKKDQKKESEQIWKEGMPCRAMYSADGFDYEAVVLTILDDENCVIKYLGYNNTEIVLISSLQPTLGKQARKHQMIEAMASKEDESSAHSTYIENDSTDPMKEFKPSQAAKHRTTRTKRTEIDNGFTMPNIPMPDVPSILRDFGEMDMPIPPPPLVGLQGAQSGSDDQALSNMLISWYMSGYYTGLYHGMKRSKQRQGDC